MPVSHESTSVNSKLGEQQAFARRNDMVGPGYGTRRGGLDTSDAAVAREADQPGRPIGAVFGGAREVAEPGMRAHHHEQVGEAPIPCLIKYVDPCGAA
jgi:hypothetical protein